MNVIRKVTVTTLCVIMIGLFFAFGCKKDNGEKGDNPPEEPTYPIEIPFTEYSLKGTSCQWTNLAYDNTVIIIDSDEKMNQYITGSGYPEIDFETQTLLLASGKTEKGISEITVNNLQQLSANEYELDMELLLNNETIAEEWAIALIIEKVSEESTVELSVAEVTLHGSKWKLEGIVDTETSTLRVLEPIDCECFYTLEFIKLGERSYYFYVIYPTDIKFEPNPEEAGMSNDEALNKIFKNFCVMSYYQSFPGAQNPKLANTYEIHFSGNLDAFLENLLDGDFFEEIQPCDYYTHPGWCHEFDGKVSVRGVNIYLPFSTCYFVDYALSTIQFEIYLYDDDYDGNEYFEALLNTQTFELRKSTLKLYFNDKKNYLLFKRRSL